MDFANDNIRVGGVTVYYRPASGGWHCPGTGIVKNPLKAQRLAEELNARLSQKFSSNISLH